MKSILVSACLLGINCKYSGGHNASEVVLALRQKYNLVPVCPEQLGGLPTPRTPSERQGNRVITKDGKDLTVEYEKGAEEALQLCRLLGCEAAIMKQRSPSCGCGTIYDGSFTGTKISGNGVTAELLLAQGIPVYTEEALPVELPENPGDFT